LNYNRLNEENKPVLPAERFSKYLICAIGETEKRL